MKNIVLLCIIGGIIYGAVKPLAAPGYFSMHDDTQVGRVVAMSRALQEGQFPVRWVADLGYGYGYPLFNFYGPLPYYFGGALHALGVPALPATKLMFFLGTVMLFISTFMLMRFVYGTGAGLIAGTLALYAPYHAVQIYVRGAVGEYWASACVPLIILGFFALSRSATRKMGIIIGGLGFAATILSHTITGYQMAVLIGLGEVLFWTYKVMGKKFDGNVFRSHVLLLGIGFGLSAFFWIPAVAEMKYTAVANQIGGLADFRNHFVCPAQLWESLWGFGGSIAGCVDGLSFKLGKIHIILALLSLGLWVYHRKISRNSILPLAVYLFGSSLFLMMSQSAWMWDHIPGFAYIQYPWRFLSNATLALSLLAGGMVVDIKKRYVWILVVVAVCVTIFVNGKWFVPQYTVTRDSQSYETREELRFRVSKISDEYLPPEIVRPKNVQEAVFDTIENEPGIAIFPRVHTAVYTRYDVVAQRATRVKIHTAYFPGWQYLVNAQSVLPKVVQGLPVIDIPKGTSTIEMRFTDTTARMVANVITALSIVWVLILYGTSKKTNA